MPSGKSPSRQRQGGVIPAGYDLNAPALPLAVAAQPAGTLPAAYSQFRVDAPNVVLETVKKAEDGSGLILRLYESWGTRTRAALALPDENVAWRYAIHSGNPITPVEEDGLPYALAAEMEDIYQWTVDFFGIQKGDNFTVIYDERFIDDSVSVGIGRIWGAKFCQGGKEYYAIPFRQGRAGPLHFSPVAQNKNRTPKSPVFIFG